MATMKHHYLEKPQGISKFMCSHILHLVAKEWYLIFDKIPPIKHLRKIGLISDMDHKEKDKCDLFHWLHFKRLGKLPNWWSCNISLRCVFPHVSLVLDTFCKVLPYCSKKIQHDATVMIYTLTATYLLCTLTKSWRQNRGIRIYANVVWLGQGKRKTENRS
jgi:hypothetical protein